MKLLVIVIFVIFSSSAFAFDREFVEKELFLGPNFKKKGQTIEDRVKQLDQFQNDIDGELENNPNDANLLFLKGLVIRAYAYTIEDPLTKNDRVEMKAMGERANGWFLKALADDNGDLTVGQLFLLSGYGSELAVQAVEKILASDRYFDDKDRVELRRNKIDHLIRLNRFDDAVDEMTKFNQDYPAFASAEWDDAFRIQIKAEKAKANKVKEAEPKSAPSTAADKLATSAPQPAVVQVETKNQTPISSAEQPIIENNREVNITENKNDEANMKLIIVGLIVLAFVFFVLWKRRKTS